MRIFKLHCLSLIHFFAASTSILILTVSPNPGRYSFIPKSDRLSSVVAVNPTVSLFVIGFIPKALRFASNTIGFVMP